MTIKVGDYVRKLTGYEYPGVVVSVFQNTSGKTRLVVECLCRQVAGMLHIYSPENVEVIDQEQYVYFIHKHFFIEKDEKFEINSPDGRVLGVCADKTSANLLCAALDNIDPFTGNKNGELK